MSNSNSSALENTIMRKQECIVTKKNVFLSKTTLFWRIIKGFIQK